MQIRHINHNAHFQMSFLDEKCMFSNYVTLGHTFNISYI